MLVRNLDQRLTDLRSAREAVPDWKRFTRAAKRLLWGPRMLTALDYLNGPGWNDGGCRILAEANLIWLRGRAQRFVMIGRTMRSDVQKVHHVLVRVRFGDVERYLDGDGASTEAALLRRWRDLEGLVDPFLLADPDARHAEASAHEIPSNPALSAQLARTLELELGHLFPAVDQASSSRSAA